MLVRDGGRAIVTSLLLLLLLSIGEGCGPGRGSGRRKRPRKLTPLVFKQHVPNVSENTLGASGLTDGPIKRSDAKFKDLVRNNNPDILFKDEEGTGADRIMSQRCKDKLNTLAISVLNQWPGVKLRVTEAWDEDGMHVENSLHYEGRAVDITTSDRDRSKYGMLARLAVEAGFDWVYYETRGHIHCSVKSDSSVAINFGGCFPPSSTVLLSSGQTTPLSQLRAGDSVLSMDAGGHLVYSDVIAFLDRSTERVATYYTLTTSSGRGVTLTSKHLIYVTHHSDSLTLNDTNKTIYRTREASERPRLAYAEEVRVGQYIFLVTDSTSTAGSSPSGDSPENVSPSISPVRPPVHVTVPEQVVAIQIRAIRGVYAPLTQLGTIVVDGYVTSCYAFLKDVQLAHTALAPLRGYHVIQKYIGHWLESIFSDLNVWSPSSASSSQTNITSHETTQDGAHWFAQCLYTIAVHLLGMDLFISL
ncbi:sonic hedgehog protein-like [Physella acuta]|uniref:sonic hedgehog protein-like n=1 Tax=Physella acuta TaxID=109671 RepID=UPI0027DBA87A|nr:sonic hedgehog protein-like [Physella acuta]XP_059150329.1 sonic hedgehog protein-like [Physella acuta]